MRTLYFSIVLFCVLGIYGAILTHNIPAGFFALVGLLGHWTLSMKEGT